MNLPGDVWFTPEHFWVKKENARYLCGITDHAQQELGEVVFVEMPRPGVTVKKSERIGDVESIKTISNLYAPLSGQIVEVNTLLEKKPELINQSPYEKGWILRMQASDESELSGLLDTAGYQEFISHGE
ncbi:MAG: glycine cleavage system protein GcvH [Atribacterota bacterium]